MTVIDAGIINNMPIIHMMEVGHTQ